MNLYLETLEKLYALNVAKAPELGLTSMRQLAKALGNPQCNYPAILVAGSNGKGSTTWKIAQALTLSGYKVGLYTSPHLSSFRERIRINGEMISEEELVEIYAKISQLNIEATYFEIVTAMAFEYFHRQKVDIAVLEVGLGGRLDATNIIEPILSIITSISLEHTQVLGDTVEKICTEKAGIARRGIPLVVGPEVPLGSLSSFKETLFLVEKEGFQDVNISIAAKGLEILQNRFPLLPEAVKVGLQQLPPCRRELFDDGFILDVAHNPASLKRLADTLQEPAVWVLSLSEGKNIEGCLEAIKDKVSFLIFTRGNHPRCLEAALLEKCWREITSNIPYHLTTSVKEAIQRAKEQKNRPVVVAGTFFMMAEAREALGVEFPKDPYCLNELTAVTVAKGTKRT